MLLRVQNERTGEGGASERPNPRTQRRLSFAEEIERLIRVTGESQATCFRVYNAEFPTFDSYQAFRQFKRRHRHQLSQPDAISREVSALFDSLPAIDTRGLLKTTRREITELERGEHENTVTTLRAAIAADPRFLEKIIDEFAWSLMRSN